MKRLLLLAVVLCGLPAPAWAYIDTAPTLGKIINDSTNIVVLRVEKVNKEKKVILFKKVADLKGTHPTQEIRHQLTDGSHPRDLKLILDWAEPGRIALWFRDVHSSATCIGQSWYQSAPRGRGPGPRRSAEGCRGERPLGCRGVSGPAWFPSEACGSRLTS